jgi:AcrR family transcriptional regulator
MNKRANRILNTTINLFLRDGIKKITMDDIAENSKVSKVTIYKYFVDKDTLYFEISKHIFSNYIEQLKSTISSDDVLIKKLYAFLDIISDFTNSGKFALCKELAKYNNTIETEYAMYLKTYKRSMLTLIDEGIENGLIKKNLDRDKIFFYIDMGVVYYQQSSEYRNKMLGDMDFQRQFMLFYINNIFTDGEQILSSE